MLAIETNRLIIRPMRVDDAHFMLGLLNEPSWLHFIGDRGVRTIEEAQRYILSGPISMHSRFGLGFCVVELKEDRCAIGICGLAKRDFLDCVDLGYALLPDYCGKGYAFEASSAVLEHAQRVLGITRIVATVRANNRDSIRLLEKLGFYFDRVVINPDSGRELMLYAINAE